MSKEDGVEIKLSANQYELLEFIGEKKGKTPDELVCEAIANALSDHDKFTRDTLRLADEAKKAGLTLDDYIDRDAKETLEKLKCEAGEK